MTFLHTIAHMHVHVKSIMHDVKLLRKHLNLSTHVAYNESIAQFGLVKH
jgi:hypothetical protein